MSNEITSSFGQISIPPISLYEFLVEKFRFNGSKDALVLANSGKKILFSDLCNIAECMSMKFEAMGVKEKMVISVCMRNLPEYLYAMLAALKLGAIWSPVNPKSTQEDLNHNYMLTKPAFVVTEEIFQQKIKEANEKTGYGKKIILIGQEEIISSSSNLSVDGKTGKHESAAIALERK
uniref:AMP-dependent synthetase/ligase domain-containing protein n=1 Tax=Romanomermis culicivorax TaxID=13658 RepID=A0A915JB22_ROMCU